MLWFGDFFDWMDSVTLLLFIYYYKMYKYWIGIYFCVFNLILVWVNLMCFCRYVPQTFIMVMYHSFHKNIKQ